VITSVLAPAATIRAASRVFLAFLLAAMATTAMAQEPMKVAVLDMTAALFNSEVAKQVDTQVREETSQDEQKVRALAEEATGLQQKLQTDASTMSDDEKRKIAEQIEEIGVQYQFLVQKIQTLVEERRQQFQETYAPNLIQAITTVVEEGAYDLVLRSEAALHFRTDYDITARVTEKLNAAPAPQPAAQ
jgi:outer membrane protein